MHVDSLVFVILALLLVLCDAFLCSVPDVSQRDVQGVIVRNLVFGYPDEDVVRVDP